MRSATPLRAEQERTGVRPPMRLVCRRARAGRPYRNTARHFGALKIQVSTQSRRVIL
jgi:hypothetical protein